MSETVRRLKINKRYEGCSCCWCGDLLFLGEDGAICAACENVHHARCWDRENGCNGAPTCVNRPLQQLAHVPRVAQTEQKPRPTLNVGESFCPTCGDVISGYCFRCRNLSTPDVVYQGPKITSQEAKDALKYAIIGLFCFGFVLGPIAIIKGTSAKKEIATDPRLDGEGMATAAQIIGAIEIGLFALYILGSVAAGVGD